MDPAFPSMRLRRAAQSGFNASHMRILGLCHQLEGFADALPNRLDAERCREVARTMLPLLSLCHAEEERLIATMDAERLIVLKASIVRIRSEHMRDRYFAEDIADALAQVSDTEPLANPEALGFMMRSFFESQRRHIAFEQEHIVPGPSGRP